MWPDQTNVPCAEKKSSQCQKGWLLFRNEKGTRKKSAGCDSCTKFPPQLCVEWIILKILWRKDAQSVRCVHTTVTKPLEEELFPSTIIVDGKHYFTPLSYLESLVYPAMNLSAVKRDPASGRRAEEKGWIFHVADVVVTMSFTLMCTLYTETGQTRQGRTKMSLTLIILVGKRCAK